MLFLLENSLKFTLHYRILEKTKKIIDNQTELSIKVQCEQSHRLHKGV